MPTNPYPYKLMGSGSIDLSSKVHEAANNHMHSDSKKQSEERAALFAAGDVKR